MDQINSADVCVFFKQKNIFFRINKNKKIMNE